MTATLRNFNRPDGRQRDGGFAPGVDERMARRARQEEREKRAALRRVMASPVRNNRDLKVVQDGELVPLLPADFLAESLATLQIHLARGHFAQAKASVDAIEQRWQLEKQQKATTNTTNVLSRHVSSLFDPRTANMIEEHCAGTIGALLDCFPEGFTRTPMCGPGTVRKIAETLLRIGAIDAADCQKRIDEWQAVMDRR